MAEGREPEHYIAEALKDGIGGAAGGLIAYWSVGQTPTTVTAIVGAFTILMVAVIYWFADNHMGTVLYWFQRLAEEDEELGAESVSPESYRPEYAPAKIPDSSEN